MCVVDTHHHACTYIYIYIHMYIHVYIYIYIYILTAKAYYISIAIIVTVMLIHYLSALVQATIRHPVFVLFSNRNQTPTMIKSTCETF